MFELNVRRLTALAGLATAMAFAGSEMTNTEPTTVVVQGGTATFLATTNVSAISVKGKSTALEARVQMRRSPGGLELNRIEARIPVKSLVTGMVLRDEHMRRYIFTTADGKTPDVTFEGQNAACSGGACQVAGNLSIRGITRPFTLPLKFREDGSAFKATGDAVVKLSAYGIEKPSQFGVQTSDDVQLHFDFSARPASGAGSTGGMK